MSVLGVVCHYESAQLRPLPNIYNIIITAASLEISYHVKVWLCEALACSSARISGSVIS